MYLKSKEDAFIEIMATCHKYCRLPGHSQTQMLMTESTAETSNKNIPDIEYYFNLPSCAFIVSPLPQTCSKTM